MNHKGKLRLWLRVAQWLFVASVFLARDAYSSWPFSLEISIGRTAEGDTIEGIVTSYERYEKWEKDDPRVIVIASDRLLRVLANELSKRPGKSRFLVIQAPDNSFDFPPDGDAYIGKNAEAHYIWRWIGQWAPDVVVAEGSLAEALKKQSPYSTGPIPVVESIKELPASIKLSGPHADMIAREERTPRGVAEALAEHYGLHYKGASYIPALALISRMRLGQTDDVQEILKPYLTGSEKLPPLKGGSQIAGRLVFGELAKQAGNERALQLIVEAADMAFDENGRPREAMPSHNEMSDAVFMACPVLAQAWSLTDDPKYIEMCLRHLRFMQEKCLREDGLYRHSPLDEAAWGRGNGFPALGLALALSEIWDDSERRVSSLSDLPDDFEWRAEIMTSYRDHLDALLLHQDFTGMWHQVVDHPESYREFTSTCMITFAMIRGVRNGWIENEKFEPPILRAWHAIKQRIDLDGHGLVDVCTGTGKQKDLEAYFYRKAILGLDDRGGAVALMLATEMMAWEAETK